MEDIFPQYVSFVSDVLLLEFAVCLITISKKSRVDELFQFEKHRSFFLVYYCSTANKTMTSLRGDISSSQWQVSSWRLSRRSSCTNRGGFPGFQIEHGILFSKTGSTCTTLK